MKSYRHFISLGYFCAVAAALEQAGLRGTSSPFDWCITDLEGVLRAIGTRFENYFCYEDFLQDSIERGWYCNERYGVWFYHDFDPYAPLKDQLSAVEEKYRRRIERFYQNIAEPTLFVRYIDDGAQPGGPPPELAYIEEHQEDILALLRSFNPENDILYIANEGVASDTVPLLHAAADENDTAARRLLSNSPELAAYLAAFDYAPRAENLARYRQKQREKNAPVRRLAEAGRGFLRHRLCRPYIHERVRSRPQAPAPGPVPTK